MDDRVLGHLIKIKDMRGEEIFKNQTAVKNMLNDFAPAMLKERIQINNFLELDGYFRLKNSGKNYAVVRAGLIKNMEETYGVNEAAAAWAADIFGEILGRVTRTEKNFPDVICPALAVNLSDEGFAAEPPRKIAAGDYFTAAITADGDVLFAGADDFGQSRIALQKNIKEISCGADFCAVVDSDGNAFAAGRNDFGQCNLAGWHGISAVSAGLRHTVGLCANGSVISAGSNTKGECLTQAWRDMVYVSAGCQCTFALKKNKMKIFYAGAENNAPYLNITGAADIRCSAGGRVSVLKTDGTAFVAGGSGKKIYGVKQISAAPDYTAALTDEGKVKFLSCLFINKETEKNFQNVCEWTDIVQIAAGRFHIAGVRANGTVAAAMLHPDPSRNKWQCGVNHWKNIFI